jgi:hypothetical protein
MTQIDTFLCILAGQHFAVVVVFSIFPVFTLYFSRNDRDGQRCVQRGTVGHRNPDPHGFNASLTDFLSQKCILSNHPRSLNGARHRREAIAQ